jgi:signal transduction histidine kinase
MLDELGLLPALRSHVKCFGARAGLKVRLRSHAGVEQLSNEQKTVLYRVAQESLTNVAKHARASRVGVNLYRLRHAVQMQIKDNGRAFEVQRQLSAAARRRLGLLGMQERVRLINGRFDIRSAPGKGTTVLVEVPFKRFERRLKHNDKNYSIAG